MCTAPTRRSGSRRLCCSCGPESSRSHRSRLRSCRSRWRICLQTAESSGREVIVDIDDGETASGARGARVRRQWEARIGFDAWASGQPSISTRSRCRAKRSTTATELRTGIPWEERPSIRRHSLGGAPLRPVIFVRGRGPRHLSEELTQASSQKSRVRCHKPPRKLENLGISADFPKLFLAILPIPEPGQANGAPAGWSASGTPTFSATVAATWGRPQDAAFILPSTVSVFWLPIGCPFCCSPGVPQVVHLLRIRVVLSLRSECCPADPRVPPWRQPTSENSAKGGGPKVGQQEDERAARGAVSVVDDRARLGPTRGPLEDGGRALLEPTSR